MNVTGTFDRLLQGNSINRWIYGNEKKKYEKAVESNESPENLKMAKERFERIKSMYNDEGKKQREQVNVTISNPLLVYAEKRSPDEPFVDTFPAVLKVVAGDKEKNFVFVKFFKSYAAAVREHLRYKTACQNGLYYFDFDVPGAEYGLPKVTPNKNH